MIKLKFLSDIYDSEYKNPNSITNKFRGQRFNMFLKFIYSLDYKKGLKILDIGGTLHFWKDRLHLLPANTELFVMNLDVENESKDNLHLINGDITKRTEFEDQFFDVVFSNSVIEHLYTYKNQRLMAKEVYRIGKRHFIQTPNYWFPVEPHFLLPYFQLYPRPVQRYVLKKTNLSRFGKITPMRAAEVLDEIKLLNHAQVKELFPNSQIYKERFFGVTKSFVAHNFEPPLLN